MGKLEPEGGKEGMFAPPLTSSPLGHFAISSPAERRLDWVEKDCSQSRFYVLLFIKIIDIIIVIKSNYRYHKKENTF